MGLVRKALFIGTAGLSDVLLGEEKKERPAARRAAKTATAQAPAKRSKRTTAASKARSRTTAKAAPERTAPPAPAPAPPVAASAAASTIGELERLAELHGKGALTAEEFSAAKARILGIALPRDGSDTPFPAVQASVAAARRIADIAAQESGGTIIARELG